MKTFVLETYKKDDGSFEYNGWWQYEDGYLYNRVGGHHRADPDEKMWKYSKVVEVNDRDDLDYSYILNPDSDLGWISPDGRFYGCGYRDHAAVAERVLKKTDDQLEDEGWVKVFFDSWNRERKWYSDTLCPTEAQRIVLERLGLEVDVCACELTTPIQGKFS